MVDATSARWPAAPRLGEDARLLFVTHSIPDAMNEGSGPLGGAYVAQHLRRRGVRRRAGSPR